MTSPTNQLSSESDAAHRQPITQGPLPPLHAVGLVMAGGILGALLRVHLSTTFVAAPASFPWTTWAENITGSFLLGGCLVLLQNGPRPRVKLMWFVCTGVLGSLTTFSNLAVEVAELARQGRTDIAFAYAAASVACGLAAAAGGIGVGRLIIGRSKSSPKPETHAITTSSNDSAEQS